jgi:two-component system sensor histidine kinase YcbA
MEAQKERIGLIWPLIFLTVFLGQVYVRPFSDMFRFSFSVPALALILLFFPNTSPVLYSAAAGLAMFLFRVLIGAASQPDPLWPGMALQHFPGFVFYLSFGVLFSYFRVQRRVSSGPGLFFPLLLCEVLANFAELFAVHLRSPQPMERAVFFVILVGIMRSAATAALYRLTVYWQERHDRQEREEQYRRMLVFFSNIKTDLLFFRKSMDDIENAMKHSYSLYEKLKRGQLGEEALMAARRIHEVKKEYQRLIVSMEKVLSVEYSEAPLRLSEICALLKAGTESMIGGRDIKIAFSCDEDWRSGLDYKMISIINNLVINSIEALGDKPKRGRIEVNARIANGRCVIEVADNGGGIAPDILDCIFEPGFSTKFDPKNGAMSTGLGLAHVKNIVESHIGGHIEVETSGPWTRFRINLPIESGAVGEC